jgi:hypothetical protein
MEIAAVFLLLIVLILIVLFVSLPLIDRQRIRTVKNNQGLSSLLAERERLLSALQELEFDQSLGKIPAEDYPVQRAELLHKGAEVLRELDSISSKTSAESGNKDKLPDIKSNQVLSSDDDLESLLARRRALRRDKTAGFCAHCGKPVLQSDVFCPSCGNSLRKN